MVYGAESYTEDTSFNSVSELLCWLTWDKTVPSRKHGHYK